MTYTDLVNILLADDDNDDCLFFRDVLDELPMPTSLTTVNDGEQLMQYLETAESPPGVIFLDLNMPRKNGYECLAEIKKNSLLKKIPVIIYSTSWDAEISDQLYDSGAHYYICKPADYDDLKKVIYQALLLVTEPGIRHGNDIKPLKENFVINK